MVWYYWWQFTFVSCFCV